MILNIIRQTIIEYSLLKKGDKVLVALSGGADSVCLTHALRNMSEELGIELYTAHLNHGIRGEEASRDEKFAKEFSESLGLRCFLKRVDIPRAAKRLGVSEETAGRRVRYEFFADLCEEYKINKIATAHNKNDNAETLVMNFMRGSSLKGLCGIPYKRGNIIRPLLGVCREDIEKYCADNDLVYMTDSTNLTDDYTRNKIRHILLPLIQKEFNSNFISTVTDNSSIIKEDSAYLESKAAEIYLKIVKNGTVQISELLSQDISIERRVVRYMLAEMYNGLGDISSGYVNDILELAKGRSGAKIDLSDNVTVRNEYGKLIMERGFAESTPDFEYRFSCGSGDIIKEIGKKVVISRANSRRADGGIYLGIDSDKDIIIRNRRKGDKFYPSGMTGSKKVKEYFIDNKIPREKRGSVPIVEIDKNIAAVGNRVDRRFLFKDGGIKIEFKDF
ncbi:MAG: tRNA lysidine(34) synthetase TilS [Oscillospiraceae bacterium]|nr:tRNA lysidine(34) synthetase TilS [Oscillospiraceae bacterium]